MILLQYFLILSFSITPFKEPKKKTDWSQIFDFSNSDQNNLIFILISICTIILASSICICIYVYCTSKRPQTQEQQRLISSKNERFSNSSNQYLTDTFQFAPALFAPASQPIQSPQSQSQQQSQQPQYQPTIFLQPYFPQNGSFSIPQQQQQTNQSNNNVQQQQQPQYIAQFIPNTGQAAPFYYQGFAPMQIIQPQTNQKQQQPQNFPTIQPIQIISTQQQQEPQSNTQNISPKDLEGVPETEEKELIQQNI